MYAVMEAAGCAGVAQSSRRWGAGKRLLRVAVIAMFMLCV